jgi:hypothetical protein
MKSVKTILNNYGRLTVEVLKLDVHKISATGKTEDSIHYVVESDNDTDRLMVFARQFFSAIETGRGPRKSSEYGGYDKSLLEYMEARGMVTGLSQRQKQRKAKALAFFINKHGDSVYREGGRQVYSDHLAKLVDELKEALRKDFKDAYIKEIRNAFSTKTENA